MQSEGNSACHVRHSLTDSKPSGIQISGMNTFGAFACDAEKQVDVELLRSDMGHQFGVLIAYTLVHVLVDTLLKKGYLKAVD